MAWVLIVDDPFDGADTAVGAVGNTTSVLGWVDKSGLNGRTLGSRLATVLGGAGRVIARPEVVQDEQGVLEVLGGENLANQTLHVILRYQGTGAPSPSNLHYLISASWSASLLQIREFSWNGSALTQIGSNLAQVGFPGVAANNRRLTASARGVNPTTIEMLAEDTFAGTSQDLSGTSLTAVFQQAGQVGISTNIAGKISRGKVLKWVELTPSETEIAVGEKTEFQVAGVNVDFTASPNPLALSGGTGASIVSQTAESPTLLTVRVQGGTASTPELSPLVFSHADSGGSFTQGVVAPYVTFDPTQVLPGVETEVVATGHAIQNHPWDVDGNTPVFAVIAGPGEIDSQTVLTGRTARLTYDGQGSLAEGTVGIEAGAGGPSGLLGINQTVLPNNPKIFTPPLTCYRTAAVAISVNYGAYKKVRFSGTAATLLLDPAALASLPSSKYPWIIWQVDLARRQQAQLTPGQSSLALASGLSAGAIHDLTYWLHHGDPDVGRWVVPASGLFDLGVRLDAGAQIYDPTLQPLRFAAFGDSYLPCRRGAGLDELPSSHPSYMSWFALLAAALGAEYSMVGMPGAGIQKGGQGEVPPFYPTAGESSWWQYFHNHSSLAEWAGAHIDEIYFNYSRNDGASGVSNTTIATQHSLMLAAVRVYQPLARIFIIPPFSQQGAVGVRSGLAAYRAAHPTDLNIFLLDLGAAAAVGLTQPLGVNVPTLHSLDGIHSDVERHAQFAGLIQRARQLAIGSGVAQGAASGRIAGPVLGGSFAVPRLG